VLERGYSLVRAGLGESRVVTDAAQVAPGDPLKVRLSRGELDCRVESVRLPGEPKGDVD
jgi:exodeoxyribonuclease VII large subunit